MTSQGKPITNLLPLPARKPILTQYVVKEPEMTPSDIYRKYDLEKPIFCLVQSGYSGPIVEKPIKIGQLMFVCCSANHRRLVAAATVDGVERLHFSFHPETSFTKCQVQHKDGTFKSLKNKRLSDMMKIHSFPMTIRFKPDLEGEANQACLRFTHSIEETTLLCNIIDRDKFDPDVLYIPAHMSSLRFKEATGIADKTPQDWERYCRRFDNDMSSVEYDMQYSTTDIANYGELKKSQLPITRLTQSQRFMKWPDFIKELNALQPKVKRSPAPLPRPENPKAGAETPELEDTYDTLYEQIDAVDEYVEITDANTQPAASKAEVRAKLTPADAGTKPSASGKPLGLKDELEKVLTTKADGKYGNMIPRAEAVGIVRQAEPVSDESAAAPGRHVIRDVTSIDDVKQLSIEELGEYLKRLKMERHVNTFRENMVDGAILLELDIALLVEDFKMSKIEAIRLNKFANTAHIPQ